MERIIAPVGAAVAFFIVLVMWLASGMEELGNLVIFLIMLSAISGNLAAGFLAHALYKIKKANKDKIPGK